MKQLVQHIRTGHSEVVDVPAPRASEGRVLVRVVASLVSAGTERTIVDFAEKNLLQKAKSRPDLVRQTLDKAQREGILNTMDAVRNRLDQPMALGYSCAGVVLECGQGVPNTIAVGDLVACAGGGFATHAEIVSVPVNLIAKLPPTSSTLNGTLLDSFLEAASFTTLGAIALQGIRLCECKLGEVVAVIGLGLLGQLTVQLLRAAGCVVIGTDLNTSRVELAHTMGAHFATTDTAALLDEVRQATSGFGVDAVLITADTKSDQPVSLAGELARSKGVVVAIGAVGMNIPRKLYYEKELDFRISRSYGPGRYDATYEERGRDYPYAFVRWTAQRNMQAFIELVVSGSVDVSKLITHRFDINDAAKAYDVITGKTGEPFLGVLIKYPTSIDASHIVYLRTLSASNTHQAATIASTPITALQIGVLGAGLFANATLLPTIRAACPSAKMVGIASGSGLTAQHTAKKFGFKFATSDEKAVLESLDINTIVVATRHNQHARQILDAFRAGKHVFCEKPLCLNKAELHEIEYAFTTQTKARLMVGFNRRFAPYVVALNRKIAKVNEPVMINLRVNAGYIPRDHWLHNPEQGGGRLIGEACHFIDLVCFLARTPLAHIRARKLPDRNRYSQDNLLLTLEFANGSIGNITYLANGDKAFSKEYLEVFGGGLSAALNDYRTLTIFVDGKKTQLVERLRPDKGHRAEWHAFEQHVIAGAPAPIPFADIVQTMNAAFAAQADLAS
jgi:predicted dehydrogenase/threonine dehydrogenase-like Zn-dependent dehydrogenase